MTQAHDPETPNDQIPEPEVRTGKTFSIIWLIPIVAAIIGGWLVYKALSEKGPEITITFKSAEGLEAGKTKLKYKDVEIGLVDSISLSKDLASVIVKAKLVKDSEVFLTDKTRFWVVRPRISAGEISGLGTLVAGAYIAVDPNQNGAKTLSFVGLEQPPVVTADVPGSRYLLRADKLGSLDSGSPIYYRQLRVGEVENYELDKDGRAITIKIFIHSPYDQFIFRNTRFWNAGGLDFSVDANGIKVNTESIVTLMLGGIAFDTPIDLESSDPAKAGDVFTLYNSFQDTLKKTYAVKGYWLIKFNGSIRGLSPGAPVEFRGIHIGKVLDINLKIDLNDADFRIPVLIEIEPERIFRAEQITGGLKEKKEFMESLVAKGLRAQLKTGNLLTGQLVVDLDFHPEAPPQQIDWNEKYPELPAIGAPLEEIFATIAKSLNKIEKLPLEEMGNDIRAAVKNLNRILAQIESTMNTINTGLTPQAIAAIDQAKKTLAAIEKTTGADSPLNYEARAAMEELSDAARALRLLVDYLERHPDSIIYGKGSNQ
jgi:paraquat-inducible protein B